MKKKKNYYNLLKSGDEKNDRGRGSWKTMKIRGDRIPLWRENFSRSYINISIHFILNIETMEIKHYIIKCMNILYNIYTEIKSIKINFLPKINK